jgi:hypothetical protein
VTVEEAEARLIELACQRGGEIAAADAESDAMLSGDPGRASAAARQLSLEVGVAGVYSRRRDSWFPFDRLVLRRVGITQPRRGGT